jgi:tRNA modification GTPase
MGDAERGARLRRLIHAPTVAIVGAPNAGKSSLINALAGRELAAASPEAGTTRDYVSAQVTLAGLACTLLDAPGLRETGDPIEARAIHAARAAIDAADLRVALAGPDQSFPRDWPDALRVRTKTDRAAAHGDLGVSAHTGDGLAALAERIREILVPRADLASEQPFDFIGPTGP